MTVKRLRLPLTIACALATALSPLAAVAQKAPAAAKKSDRRPALVVGIVIDGLDIDRLQSLQSHFGDNGFNRLLNNGVTITTLDYGSHLDNAAATAVIYTGAAPAVNGIAADYVYDPVGRRQVSVFLDPTKIGNSTDETLSPAALRVSNLTDELRIGSEGLGLAHSVAADPEQAIAMSGHAGNSACWINDKTGRWASTTYYTEFPTAAQTINHLRPLSSRLDTLAWVPTMPDGAYADLPSYKRTYSFRHSYPRTDTGRYEAFKTSAPGNSEVASISADLIKSLSLGSRESADMLNINFDLQPYTYSRVADTRAELLDSYIRLDRDLDRLFRAIDADGPGMDRTLLFVAGTPANPYGRRDDERWRVPSGNFSPARAVSLLKVNLMAAYGNGDWVIGYHDGQFYLNRDLIKERGKDLDEIRRESAEFLRRMSGVTSAVTIDDIVATGTGDSHFPPARNIDINSAGDIFVSVAPGWSVSDDSNTDAQLVTRGATAISTAIILCPGVDARTIDTPVDARVIAPTVARLLRIRSPNGSQLPPLRL